MEAGDFTALASSYFNRPGYSETVLRIIAKEAGVLGRKDSLVADVGAGTGKLTEQLVAMELPVIAVEPNQAMREEGKKTLPGVKWLEGSGENTGLSSSSVDWLLMASSFHWVDLEKGLTEFHRVLKPGGCFTALWNPRDLKRSEFHLTIEAKIQELVPNLERRSSGISKSTENLEQKLISTGHFSDCFYIETSYDLVFPTERYLGAWTSVNDIQAQAGPDRWEKILAMIREQCAGMNEVVIPYKTRAWTVRRS